MGRSVPKTVCIDGVDPGAGGSQKEQVYQIELITPMYGGGVEAGVVDEEMPVRATSIRGQLRFWWRLLYGLGLSDMREKEAEIFGSTRSASKIALKVGMPDTCLSLRPMASIEERQEQDGKKKKRIVFEKGKEKLQYAIFPFQGKIGKRGEPDVTPSLALADMNFELLVSFSPKLSDTQREQVLNSLHGWINFGGLGARTRRGCGALYSKDCAMERAENISSLLSGAPGIETVLMGNVKDDAESAWCEMVDLMKQFRQEAGIGRNEGQSKEKTKMPGRSRWPEPDTIRRRVEAHLGRHAPAMQVEGFPRARFGMPIIFHFKDSDFGGKSKPDMDPIDTCLRPESSSRMASPVLLSPVKLKNGKVIPVIIFLKTRPLGSLLLERSDKECAYPISVEQIVNPKFASYDKSPMGKPEKGSSKERSSKGDALEAFMAYLKEKDYKKVSL